MSIVRFSLPIILPLVLVSCRGALPVPPKEFADAYYGSSVVVTDEPKSQEHDGPRGRRFAHKLEADPPRDWRPVEEVMTGILTDVSWVSLERTLSLRDSVQLRKSVWPGPAFVRAMGDTIVLATRHHFSRSASGLQDLECETLDGSLSFRLVGLVYARGQQAVVVPGMEYLAEGTCKATAVGRDRMSAFAIDVSIGLRQLVLTSQKARIRASN